MSRRHLGAGRRLATADSRQPMLRLNVFFTRPNLFVTGIPSLHHFSISKLEWSVLGCIDADRKYSLESSWGDLLASVYIDNEWKKIWGINWKYYTNIPDPSREEKFQSLAILPTLWMKHFRTFRQQVLNIWIDEFIRQLVFLGDEVWFVSILAANDELSVFGAKIPTPFFFMAAAIFLPWAFFA